MSAPIPQEILSAAGWVIAAASGFASANAFLKKETQAAADAVRIDLQRELDELKHEIASLRAGLGRSRQEARRAQLLASSKGYTEIVDILEEALNDLDVVDPQLSS